MTELGKLQAEETGTAADVQDLNRLLAGPCPQPRSPGGELFWRVRGVGDAVVKGLGTAGPVPADYVLDPGAVVVAMTEQAPGLLGSSGLIPDDGQTWLDNQRIGLVRSRADVDERFLYYLFNAPTVRTQINATATGVKVRHTAPKRIAAVQVRVPRRQTQSLADDPPGQQVDQPGRHADADADR